MGGGAGKRNIRDREERGEERGRRGGRIGEVGRGSDVGDVDGGREVEEGGREFTERVCMGKANGHEGRRRGVGQWEGC